jgi:hypothetical protein
MEGINILGEIMRVFLVIRFCNSATGKQDCGNGDDRFRKFSWHVRFS